MALDIDPKSIAEALRRNVESWEPTVDSGVLTLLAANALFGITPSCSQRRQAVSSLSIFHC